MNWTPVDISSFSHSLGYETAKPSSAFWYLESEPETLVVSETDQGGIDPRTDCFLGIVQTVEPLFDRKTAFKISVEDSFPERSHA